jgi:hypothetical protein
MRGICADCEYYHATTAKSGLSPGDGECRKHPPTVGDPVRLRDGDEERFFGNFPRVIGDERCGEFKRCTEAFRTTEAPDAKRNGSIVSR